MNKELINELNELSEYWDLYKDRMKAIATQLVEELSRPRICEYGLQMESCRQCLFETLCRLDKQKKASH